mmetsp:Transcript_73955/g.213943  ORF Transcript_73955/g.213943 Transcript_73955/m.213943 type:complete len:437 (+) Transcript_73955:2346-3656(+)
MPANAEELVVELVGVVDHVGDWHEVAVGDGLLGDALAPQEVLGQESRSHRPHLQALPEGLDCVGAGKSACHPNDRDTIRPLSPAPGQWQFRNCGGLTDLLGALRLDEVQERTEGGVRIDVKDGHGQSMSIGKLRCDLRCQLRVAAEVEEVLVQVQAVRIQVQRLRPDGLDDGSNALLALRVALGAIRPNRRNRVRGRGLVTEGLEIKHARELLAVKLPALAPRGTVNRHWPEIRGHHPPRDLHDRLPLHALDYGLVVQALLRLHEAQQAIHNSRGLIERNDTAQGDAIHSLHGPLHDRNAHLEPPDLHGVIDPAANLEDWRVPGDQPSAIARLVPSSRPDIAHLGRERLDEAIIGEGRLLEVAGRQRRSTTVQFARNTHGQNQLGLGVDDGHCAAGRCVPCECERGTLRLVAGRGRDDGIAHITCLPTRVVVHQPA